MKKRILFACRAGAFCLVAIGASPHAALATPGSVWAFGDSLSDNGNIARILPGYSNGPGYDGARFSNGPVYVEYLPGLLGQGFVPSNDRAVGGAFAGTGNLVGGFLPGTATEIANFAASGSRFGAHDTVLLLAGANDYFGVLAGANGGAINVAAQNARVTGDIVSDASRLTNLGARTLVVLNVPDLGLTPRYLGNATATALSAGTDSALPSLLRPLAGNGRNVYLVDLNGLLHEAVADPSRFGLSDVTHACTAEPSCVGADVATQNRTLFWDTVHPNTAVHQIIAAAVANQLGAADAIGMQGQVALETARGFSERLIRQGAGDGAVPIGDGRVSVFLQADHQSGRFDAQGQQDSFGDDILSTSAGFSVWLAPYAEIGVAVGYSRADAGATDAFGRDDAASLRTDAYHIGSFARIERGGLFAGLAGSYTALRGAQGSRTGLLAGERIDGAPDGEAGSVAAALGYRLQSGRFRIGPVARFAYTHASLDGYTETGEPVLVQHVGRQSLDSVLGRAGLEADARFRVPLGTLMPYAGIAAAREFLDGSRTLDTSFVSAGLPIRTALPGYGETFGVAGGGLSLSSTRGNGVDLGFQSSFARRDVVQRDVLLRVHLRF
ncbi:autotransporter domain-containing protein [Acetobacteraceae bacterium KSS8]|uniref:Autotransporter domain-containing protein n=1 Tax=Endosaccharibacter trunci TaxID=2812733 RepID=A0ABT1W4S1_9PROT|nr:autotransporter domain-containing protein [Acetobacteraceae bacterium KSS8]